MKVIQSRISDQVQKVLSIDIGDLYFFNNIVVSEIKEGVHVTYENSQEFIKVLSDYFGTAKPFGLVSNMVNSYSVNLTDSARINEDLKNISAYAMVSYNAAGKLSAEIASNFCNAKDVCFEDLYEAANTVYNKVKKVQIPV